MAEKDSGASFTIGFILGAAIGVAIGFLYAPKPGGETRALLKEKAERAKEKASEVAEKAKEAAVKAEKRVEEKLGQRKATA
ncbi:YtxH domain-containing protein [Chloroflexota bacterium]